MPPQFRHQSSFEGVLDFSEQPGLQESQRLRGKHRFYQIVQHFRDLPGSNRPYSQPLLIQYTYDYARSEQSKDKFLQVFFDAMGVPLDSQDGIDCNSLAADFKGFATYLLESFFVPLKASGSKTAQPTPKYDSAVQNLNSGHLEVGTSDRMSALRGACLKRDHFRCVISRAFSRNEFLLRELRDGDQARDDEGMLLLNDETMVQGLEVAHIFPHSLTQADSKETSELSKAKKAALNILNMFDLGIVSLIEAIEIDRPRNAMTLSHEMHNLFGCFQVFFTEVSDFSPDGPTYKIDSFDPPFLKRNMGLPITRTLFNTENIDMPSPRLLATHRAIAHVMHLSGAGEYIDKLFREMDEDYVRSDGSSRLAEMVTLRLGGWWDGRVSA